MLSFTAIIYSILYSIKMCISVIFSEAKITLQQLWELTKEIGDICYKLYFKLDINWRKFFHIPETESKAIFWDTLIQRLFYVIIEQPQDIYRTFDIIQYWRLYIHMRVKHDININPEEYYSWVYRYEITWTPLNAFFYGLHIKTYKLKTIDIKILQKFNFIITWYQFFKNVILSVILALTIVYILINIMYVNIVKQTAIWLTIGFLFFWLISGFNFFLKRYKYGKFTSAILRFWKRTNSIFWIVEGFLFCLFFYYYLNSSQEPLYFYDFSALNQTHLFSLYNIYNNYLLLLLLIWYTYIVLLKLSTFTVRQSILHLTVISILLIYLFIIESYQFYYILTIFFENVWSFNSDTNLWVLEYEAPRIRVKNQYLILALIAKYWHFLFIFISWLFFIFKSFEQKKITYSFLGWNLQNLIILFVLNLLTSVQWIKWLIRRYYDAIYYWFFTDTNYFFSKLFVIEFTYFLSNFFATPISAIFLFNK